jgi:hypothetical protein
MIIFPEAAVQFAMFDKDENSLIKPCDTPSPSLPEQVILLPAPARYLVHTVQFYSIPQFLQCCKCQSLDSHLI